VIALVAAASPGTTMAIRWISVYRAKRASVQAAARFMAAQVPADAQYYSPAAELGPPERNFPLTVVIAHGVFAVITPTLVLLTALGVFGS
jgi:hypothetical protein